MTGPPHWEALQWILPCSLVLVPIAVWPKRDGDCQGDEGAHCRAGQEHPDVIEGSADQGRANDRAGFIDAVVNSPRSMRHAAIVAPTAIAASVPISECS